MKSSRWTSDDLQRKLGLSVTKEPAAKKKGGRTAKPVTIDGIKFASTMEGNCYTYIKASGLQYELQKTYELQPGFRHEGKAIIRIKYAADFVITHGGQTFIIDVKGHAEPGFLIRRKMMLYQGKQLIVVSGFNAFVIVVHLIKTGESPSSVYQKVDSIHNK